MEGSNNNSHQSSLSDQTTWKSKLRASLGSKIHIFEVTPKGKHKPSWDTDTLVQIRKDIKQDMEEELQKESNKLTPIMKAARYGHYSTIEQLLTDPFTSIKPERSNKTVLHMVLEGIISSTYKDDSVKICMENLIAGKDICDSIIDAYFPPDDFNMFPEEKPDHYKCLDFILKTISPEKLDINSCDDAGNSALHYAVAWSETTATKALLQAGAYTCKPNKNGMIPLKIISPQVLEEYLDSCVLSNDYPLGHDNFQIYFNYQLFVRPKKQACGGNGGIEAACKELIYEGSCESEPLFVLNNRPDLRKFLTHPVIRNYFCLKWLVVKKYSYIENIFFIWFFSFLSIYLFLNLFHIYIPSWTCPLSDDGTLSTCNPEYRCCDAFIKNIDHERKFNTSIYPMTLIFGGILLVFRVLMLVFNVHRHYFSPKSFILKSRRMWSQIIWAVVTLSFVCLYYQKHFHTYLAIVVIAVSIEFLLVLGRSPEHSMGIQMVKVFVINVCKYLFEFFVLILFLAISFVVFFNTGFSSIIKPKNITSVNGTCTIKYSWMVESNYNGTSEFLKSDCFFINITSVNGTHLYEYSWMIDSNNNDTSEFLKSVRFLKNITCVDGTCPDKYSWMIDLNNNDTSEFWKSDRVFPLYIIETFITMLRGDPQVKTFLPFDNIPLGHAVLLVYCFLAVYTINNLMIVVPMAYANQVVNEAKSVVMVSFLKFIWYVENAAAQDPTQLLDLSHRLLLWSVFCFRWCLCNNPKPPKPFYERICVTNAMTDCRKEPFCIHDEKTLNYLNYGPEIFDNAVNILKRAKQHDEMKKKLSESESTLKKMENVLQDTQLRVLENQRVVQENQCALQEIRENQLILQENQHKMRENEENLRRDLLNGYKEVIAQLKLLQTSTGIDYSSSTKKLERRNTE